MEQFLFTINQHNSVDNQSLQQHRKRHVLRESNVPKMITSTPFKGSYRTIYSLAVRASLVTLRLLSIIGSSFSS